jgi:hypothetical protein
VRARCQAHLEFLQDKENRLVAGATAGGWVGGWVGGSAASSNTHTPAMIYKCIDTFTVANHLICHCKCFFANVNIQFALVNHCICLCKCLVATV